MGKKYIRVRADGFLYEFNEILAANPSCEVVDEEDIKLELMSAEEVDAAKAKSGDKRRGLTLETKVEAAPTKTSPELAAEASKGLPK